MVQKSAQEAENTVLDLEGHDKTTFGSRERAYTPIFSDGRDLKGFTQKSVRKYMKIKDRFLAKYRHLIADKFCRRENMTEDFVGCGDASLDERLDSWRTISEFMRDHPMYSHSKTVAKQLRE